MYKWNSCADSTYAYGNEICRWLSLPIYDSKQPQRIDILNDRKIIQIDSGFMFVVILTDDGLVYLASGDSKWKTNNTLRLISNGNDRYEMIACGQYFLLLLRQDGIVFAMGNNKSGQLTACGGEHSLALTNTNQIYSWGCNKYGQLGLGDQNNRTKPTLISFSNDLIENLVAGVWHTLILLKNGQCFGCGYYCCCCLNDDNFQQKYSNILIKIPIENIQNIACTNYHTFSLAFDRSSSSSYYVWGKIEDEELLKPEKILDRPKSFAAATAILFQLRITYGLTSAIHVYESNDSISIIELFDNPDNYDVEFIVDNKRILACKCYLKITIEYYNRMFSGHWKENSRVIIYDYSYDTYYAYLRMLHNGRIGIKQSNIIELIDLANCYGDERLIRHCRTFIRKNLNEQTLFTYLPLINKFEINDMHDKLIELTIEDILPKITNNFLKNQEIITKFLLWFSEQKSSD
uniref:RCC1 and BTB domain-containing protein 2-like n=1 Tax=Dermatophagoides pteronyssinus TaxID=6956 RepID=A0A6P6YJC8_DERPT|nr:RCC1 and BTB domain-containing protein 2-like [Dermatophagoides pteronyssinus]